MSKVQVTEGLKCPECDHTPFRNKAGLGAHMSAIHRLRLDGTPAKRRTPRTTPEIVLIVKGHKVALPLSDNEIRQLLVNHPEAAADALLAS